MLCKDDLIYFRSYVIIAMEALDTLLLTCHSQSINMFVESFLTMVQKLLECREPQLQVLATTSVSVHAILMVKLWYIDSYFIGC